MYRPIISALLGVCVILLAAWLGLAALLGAHPSWEVQVALIGAPIGALLAMLLGWLERGRTAFFAGLIFAAVGLPLAMRGKAAFDASYAEDQLAGVFWYYGWVAIFIGVTLALSVLISRASGPAGRLSAPPPLG